MSRVGLKPITLPNGVTLTTEQTPAGVNVAVKGPKGELSQVIHSSITLNQDGSNVTFSRASDDKQIRSFHGLYRSLINNMVVGVTEGYVKELHIEGIGYRAQMTGTDVEFALGYSHKIKLTPPAGITVEVTDQTEIKISGCDKQLVGEFAAKIRSLRKPEPYKGKGVRYKDEQIKRKDVKSA